MSKRAHGTGHLFKREWKNKAGEKVESKIWSAQFKVRGKKHVRSTGETSRKKAEAILRGWLSALDTGKYSPAKASGLLVDELLSNLETPAALVLSAQAGTVIPDALAQPRHIEASLQRAASRFAGTHKLRFHEGVHVELGSGPRD